MGLGRERRKEEGGDCGSPWPVAQKRALCRQGHCHEPPPPPRPCTAMGQGGALDVTWEGHPSINWVWTLPPQNSQPHSRCSASWPEPLAVHVKSGPPLYPGQF